MAAMWDSRVEACKGMMQRVRISQMVLPYPPLVATLATLLPPGPPSTHANSHLHIGSLNMQVHLA